MSHREKDILVFAGKNNSLRTTITLVVPTVLAVVALLIIISIRSVFDMIYSMHIFRNTR